MAEQPTDLTTPEDATHQETAVAVQMSGKDYGRLSADDLFEIVRLRSRGLTQRQIAEIIGCSQPTVCYALQRAEDKPETIKALMRMRAPEMVQTWFEKAQTAPDHRGAKEFVEAAHTEIRAQAANSAGGAGVMIVVYGKDAKIGPGELPVIDVSPAKVGDAVSLSVETLSK